MAASIYYALGIPATAAWHDVAEAPNVPVDRAPEKITRKGPSLHKPGEEGYR